SRCARASRPKRPSRPRRPVRKGSTPRACGGWPAPARPCSLNFSTDLPFSASFETCRNAHTGGHAPISGPHHITRKFPAQDLVLCLQQQGTRGTLFHV